MTPGRSAAGILVAALVVPPSGCGAGDGGTGASAPERPEAAASSPEARALERAIVETTADRAAYPRTLTARCHPQPSSSSRAFECELGDERSAYAVELLPNGSFIARSRRSGPTIMGCCASVEGGGSER